MNLQRHPLPPFAECSRLRAELDDLRDRLDRLFRIQYNLEQHGHDTTSIDSEIGDLLQQIRLIQDELEANGCLRTSNLNITGVPRRVSCLPALQHARHCGNYGKASVMDRTDISPDHGRLSCDELDLVVRARTRQPRPVRTRIE